MIRLITARVLLPLVLWALAGQPLVAHAETLQGTPLLRRYLPADYDAAPQHWSIATDASGRLFVGNGEGVLRYDGQAWDLIELPGRLLGREVVAGKDGRIYVGSYDTFGWLQRTPDGEMVYRELLTAAGLSGRERAVGIVWQVVATVEGVYFRTEKALYFLDYDHQRPQRWPLGKAQRDLHVQGGELYARIDGVGFCRFVGGRFVLEPGGARFAAQGLLGVINRPGWRLLVGDEGLYRADDRGIRPMPHAAGSELRGSDAYEVLALDDGSFVVGTLGGELLRYGPDYRLRERIKLGSFGIVALGTDHEGGLWAATEGDLVRMSLPSPWSFIGAAHGLTGTVFDFEWHAGELWLATTRGLLRMHADGAGTIETRAAPWIELEAFALAGTDSGLLIGHRDGLMVLDPGAAQPRALLTDAPESVLELKVSTHHADRIYALGEQHLFVIERRAGRWQLGFALPLAGASAATLLETGADELWFGDSRGGPQRWTLDVANRTLLRKDVFGPRHGLLLDAAFGSSVFLLDGVVHVVSGQRGFRHTGAGFVADAGPPFTLVERPDELQIEVTPLGTYAYTQRQLYLRADGQASWQPLHLGSRLAAGYSRVRHNRDGVVRMANWNGLLQFNPDETLPLPAPLTLRFESISVGHPDRNDDRLLPLGEGAALAEISSGERLHFRYGMVSMDSQPEFRYRLQGTGLSDEWSSWADSDLWVRAISAGDYQLQVQARTTGGRSVAPISFSYRVLPRWHEHWWAWLIGALLAGAAVFAMVLFVVRRRTRRYAEITSRLETRIGERTRELEQANRRLAELATEDPLTGVANRRAMETGLQREWVRCLDQQLPLSVLMIDVDQFKRYNDTHGHLQGDVMLRAIAQTLHAAHDPQRELLARFGGEEFALLLPGVAQDEALRRAESIRQALQLQVGETISVGVAGFVPTVDGGPTDLLRCADDALYRAKRAGRNRTEAAFDLPA